MRRIRIMLADDHQVLLDGLTTLLSAEPEFEVAGTANDGKSLLQSVNTADVDLVIMDLNMPRMDGLQTLAELKRSVSDVKVMILSNYNQKELVRKVQETGADGYVLKSTSAQDLINAIRDVAKGIKLFPSVEDENISTESFFADEFLKKYNLTKREVEIIRHLAKGMSSKEICDVLHISNFTVDTHRRNILRKLNINNSVGVVSFARQHGLIE